MGSREWLQVPLGHQGRDGRTRTTERTVLVAVHTVVTGQRLLDVVDLIESDPRVQVVFTQAPDLLANGVGKFLSALGGLVVPWLQATRTRFDLIISASYDGTHELDGRILVLPHGAGYGKKVPDFGGGSAPTGRAVFGLDTQSLVRGGRIIPSAIVLSHDNQRALLGEQCPSALRLAAVAGDPCFDRLVASLPLRDRYREALGVRGEQRLVVSTSTWGTRSLFGRSPRLIAELSAEISAAGDQFACLLHPDIWYGHGPRQVRAWLADAARAGMRVVGPEVDWRVLLVAADYVVGDHGSVTGYAAAIGRPVLLAEFPDDDVAPGSVAEAVGAVAPRLCRDVSLAQQFRRASEAMTAGAKEIADRVTSVPGRSRAILREKMYSLLGIDEPGGQVDCVLIPPPTFGAVA